MTKHAVRRTPPDFHRTSAGPFSRFPSTRFAPYPFIGPSAETVSRFSRLFSWRGGPSPPRRFLGRILVALKRSRYICTGGNGAKVRRSGGRMPLRAISHAQNEKASLSGAGTGTECAGK
jgi:hypothetical protein